MAKQKNKSELLKDIQVERRLLENALGELSHEDMTLAGVVDAWSVKDILAHLAAWEQLFLEWYESGLQGKAADTKPVSMSKRAIDAINQQIFTQNRQRSLEAVMVEFHNSYRQILASVQSIPEEEMFLSGIYAWTGKHTLADYIAGNTCNHYYWARTKIRAWLKGKNMQ